MTDDPVEFKNSNFSGSLHSVEVSQREISIARQCLACSRSIHSKVIMDASHGVTVLEQIGSGGFG